MPKRWQVPILTGVNFEKRRESQKAIVTIEFTTLILYIVLNFIKIEAFAVLCPKPWPTDDRCQHWQASIVTIEVTALDLCRLRNFIKIEAFAVLRPKPWPKKMIGANIDRYQESQKTIVFNEFSNFKLFTLQNFVENG